MGEVPEGARRVRLPPWTGEIRQVMAMFLAQGPRWIAEMRRAAASGDAEPLARAARELAGAASVVQAFPLEWVCSEIQTRACEGDVDAAGRLFPTLAAAWERVRQDLPSRGFSSLAPLAETDLLLEDLSLRPGDPGH